MENMVKNTSQVEATRRYRNKYPEKIKHDRYINQAKIFIKKYATNKDLKDVVSWIDEKNNDLQKGC